VESTRMKWVFFAATDKGRKVYYGDPSVWDFFLEAKFRDWDRNLPAKQ